MEKKNKTEEGGRGEERERGTDIQTDRNTHTDGQRDRQRMKGGVVAEWKGRVVRVGGAGGASAASLIAGRGGGGGGGSQDATTLVKGPQLSQSPKGEQSDLNLVAGLSNSPPQPSSVDRVQELCESRGGRPGLSVLMSFTVSVDVKQH